MAHRKAGAWLDLGHSWQTPGNQNDLSPLLYPRLLAPSPPPPTALGFRKEGHSLLWLSTLQGVSLSHTCDALLWSQIHTLSRGAPRLLSPQAPLTCPGSAVLSCTACPATRSCPSFANVTSQSLPPLSYKGSLWSHFTGEKRPRQVKLLASGHTVGK